MKAIFLDFDGVLNTENYQAKLRVVPYKQHFI